MARIETGVRLLSCALLLGLVLLPTVAAVGCGGGGELVKSKVSRNTAPDVAAGDVQAAVSGNTEFALDLYQQLAQEEGNLFFSPHSISVSLAMTYAGARGETERQMAETLHFTLPQDHLHPALNALDLKLAGRGEGAEGRHGEPFRLHITNALWGQTGYAFLPEFLDTLAENYGAGMRVLDFASDPEASRVEINRWISRQTEGKIEEALSPDLFEGQAVLVLTNAVYFAAAWHSKFKFYKTQPGKFTRLDQSKVTAEMMQNDDWFRYAEGEGWQAVELPYDGEEIAFVLLLPAAGRFPEFEQALGSERLQSIIASLELASVDVTMPKYHFEASFRLDETLADMGMPDAFGPADFSGMDGSRFLYLTAVVHKSVVLVDEEGTQAAAATSVIAGSAVPDPKTVRADRPFIFLIRDVETGAILFLGRVLDPTAR